MSRVTITFGERVALQHMLRHGLGLIRGAGGGVPAQELAASAVVLASEKAGVPMEFPEALQFVRDGSGPRANFLAGSTMPESCTRIFREVAARWNTQRHAKKLRGSP